MVLLCCYGVILESLPLFLTIYTRVDVSHTIDKAASPLARILGSHCLDLLWKQIHVVGTKI